MASENGWEPARATAAQCEWVTVPGTNVTLQLLKGWPLTILRAFAADFNAYIEPLRDADSAAYTPTNSVATSNHLNGTAMDLNWSSHPFRVLNAGFSASQIATARELLDFYEDTVWWGNDWNTPKDAMHWNMSYNTYGDPRLGDFINRKIRPDGFSTFRRSGVPPPPQLSKADQYALAVMAEGRRRNITPRGIQIAFSVVFVESGWKMYANSNVPESLTIPHDAVGSDHDSVGLFQQRCPMWGPADVLMNPALSAGLFYDRLVKMDYNDGSRSPGSFAADVQRPAAQYRYRYDERFGDAAALYNRLSGAQPIEEGFLMALSDQQQRELYDAVCGQRPSMSPLHPPGEGNVGGIRDVVGYIDGSVHWLAVKSAAELGHPKYLDLLKRVAADPSRPDDAKLAQAILADIEAKRNAPVQAVAEAYKAPPQIVYVDRVVDAPQPAVTLAAFEPNSGGSTGQIIGRAYDALEELRLADALPIENRAPLAALIAVLQTKNGSAI